MGSKHRVPTPPLPLRVGKAGRKIIWKRKLPPPPRWERRSIQPNHIKFRTCSAVAPMWTPSYKRKCWGNSGGPLVNSLLWGSKMDYIVLCYLAPACPPPLPIAPKHRGSSSTSWAAARAAMPKQNSAAAWKTAPKRKMSSSATGRQRRRLLRRRKRWRRLWRR